jgi:cysteine rich repeat protein
LVRHGFRAIAIEECCVMSELSLNQGRLPITAAAGCFMLGLAWLAAPAPAAAQGTSEQRSACEQDAYRLCSDVVPDVNRTTSCLRRHRMSLSPACRAAFAGKGARRARGSQR